ncbi:hypothetical protein MHP7448_0705 [Mesomycoplasma hyopneumoniae 7448]|uniref:Uncharacterized protein n=1 Tax=Mesomycoplasma hyopneumoniae (strain 7448) TaxID=262722 RepID=A4Q7X2_MESH7|nr:hypothetical protein MHP7448_0705 [Mesomycoplasma hyopneumoniae 7448]
MIRYINNCCRFSFKFKVFDDFGLGLLLTRKAFNFITTCIICSNLLLGLFCYFCFSNFITSGFLEPVNFKNSKSVYNLGGINLILVRIRKLGSIFAF